MRKESAVGERLINGIIRENPTFVLTLGMCPTLAVTTSAMNGLGMGLTTMVVLALSNMIISAMRKIIPDKVRIPAFIVIIASFVTVMQLLLQGFLPGLYDSLGIYIPLIVVNCIILGRAEAYASKNPIIPSLFDGIGMGVNTRSSVGCSGNFGSWRDIRLSNHAGFLCAVFHLRHGARSVFRAGDADRDSEPGSEKTEGRKERI